MSSPLALGATMRVIADLIDRSIDAASVDSVVGAARTTVQSPDLVPVGLDSEPDHLNLFLYAVTLNSGWRNTEVSRAGGGARVGRPPLAVDLHFMLSAYGGVPFHKEILLGVGMQALHEQPFLDRGQIAQVFSAPVSPEDTSMALARLDQQVEQIKIAPHDLTADELYKLWTAFGSKCRPSAAYIANVVLIDSRARVVSARPVLSRNIALLPVERPVVDSITPSVFALVPGPVQLRLTGRGFTSPGTMVRFGDARAAFDQTGPEEAFVTVPATVRPGLNLLQVVREVALGAPPLKPVTASVGAPFIVQPAVTAVTVQAAPRRVVASVTPDCDPAQTATLLLDPVGGLPGRAGYAIDAAPAAIVPGAVSFDATDVPAGVYLVRLRANGTESVPDFDPAAGFTGPRVTL